MVESAKVWTGDFYAHILNSDSARQELRKAYIELQKVEKLIITEVLHDVPEDDSLDEELRLDLKAKVRMVVE